MAPPMDRIRRATRNCFGCFSPPSKRDFYSSQDGKASFITATTVATPNMAHTDFNLRAFSSPPMSPTSIRPEGRLSAVVSDSPKSHRTSSQFTPDIELPIKDGFGGSAYGFLHLPPVSPAAGENKTAVILLPGATGGVAGPSSMYLALSMRLPAMQAPVPVLRLDYRFPGRTTPCVADTKAAMNYLRTHHDSEQFILVGWAFGSAPALTLAGKDVRVIGAVGIASQTANGMTGIREAGRRSIPVLLLHGTGDKSLDFSCSKNLYQSFWEGYNGDDNKASLVLFEDDDHRLSRNVKLCEEYIVGFVADCAGLKGVKSGMSCEETAGRMSESVENNSGRRQVGSWE